jgi:hypothetical protein
MVIKEIKNVPMIWLTENLLEERPICRHEELLITQPLSSSEVHLYVARGCAGMKTRNHENDVGCRG